MATHEELHKQQRQAEYVEALQRERDGYVQKGKPERAQAVADELAKLGVKPDGAKVKKEPTLKRRMLNQPQPGPAKPADPEEGG